MKSVLRTLAAVVAGASLLIGCSKAPVQEASDAQAAVEATVSAGAETYAAEELRKVRDALAAAQAEVTAQEQKLFKNFDQAKAALAQAKAEAEALGATIPARKEAARNAAVGAEAEALSSVDEARTLLAQAPTGKETSADLEAFQADLQGIADALPEVRSLIEAESYAGAAEKARTLKEKAQGISEQIRTAMAKTAQ